MKYGAELKIILKTRSREVAMVISRSNQTIALGKKSGLSLLVLMGLLLIAFVTPIARADTADDLTRALSGSQKAYVSDGVKGNAAFMAKNQNIESSVKDLVSKLKGKADTRVAVISSAIIPAQFNKNTDSYGNFLYTFLNTPDVLLLVNAETNSVTLLSDKLSASERQALINDTKGALQSNVTNGTVQLAEKTADKIASNSFAGTVTVVAIVLVIVLVIAGTATYVLMSTKKKWTGRVKGVEQLANQVSDQVVRVSDDINFLPDAGRAQTDADFGAATRNFSEANTKLRELQGVSPITLLLKGPEYERKLNLTGSQFDEAQRALLKVEQQVQRSLPS